MPQQVESEVWHDTRAKRYYSKDCRYGGHQQRIEWFDTIGRRDLAPWPRQPDDEPCANQD